MICENPATVQGLLILYFQRASGPFTSQLDMSTVWYRFGETKTNKNIASVCPGQSKAEEEYELLTSWVDLFTRDTIAVLGIFGNIIIIMICVQRHMRNTFNKLLVALAFFDILTLTVSLVVSCMKTSKNIFRIAFPYIIWPLVHFAANASVLMTIVIAYERFIAVRHPLTYKKGRRYRVLRYVSFVIIIAFIFNVTKFFEYEPDDCNGIKFTNLYTNNVYLVYNIVIYRLLITTIVPSLVLIYLYSKIYYGIKESHQMQATCSQRSGSVVSAFETNEAVKRKESKQAGIFAGVVITFLICNVPDVFVKIVHITKYIQPTTDTSLWFLIALKIRDFCIMFNSAINILIYTCISDQFRKEFKRAFQKSYRGIFPFTPILSNASAAPTILCDNCISLRENDILQNQEQTSL